MSLNIQLYIYLYVHVVNVYRYKQIDRCIDRQIDRQTDRQIDRQTDRQTDKLDQIRSDQIRSDWIRLDQIDRQTNRQIQRERVNKKIAGESGKGGERERCIYIYIVRKKKYIYYIIYIDKIIEQICYIKLNIYIYF